MPVEILTLALATYRLQTLWLTDEITRPLREAAIRRGGRVAFLAGCVFCVSLWMGLVSATLWMLGGLAGRLLVAGFAASGGALFLALLWARAMSSPAAASAASAPAAKSWSRLAVALLVFALAGCSSAARVGHSGPVTVILDDPEVIAEHCAKITKDPRAVGCAVLDWFIIMCPVNDAECVAHEVRHLLDPEWKHE